jgi:hypothetical protein
MEINDGGIGEEFVTFVLFNPRNTTIEYSFLIEMYTNSGMNMQVSIYLAIAVLIAKYFFK